MRTWIEVLSAVLVYIALMNAGIYWALLPAFILQVLAGNSAKKI